MDLVTEELRTMLESHCELERYVEWLRRVADDLVDQQPASNPIYRAQNFLYCWAQYTSLVMCDLTCRGASSLGAFLHDTTALLSLS